MKRLLLITLLLPLFAVSQQTIKITYPGYTSYWNAATKIPDSVVYIAKPHAKVADREPGFHADGKIPSFNKDYAHSGYDIGHCCNASDENGNKTDEYNSFSYCNVFPQRPNCNRLTWLALENQVRVLATKYKQVRVKIYWNGTLGTIGVDKVTIPKYCVKEIWYSGVHQKYVMPNADTINRHVYTYYLVK